MNIKDIPLIIPNFNQVTYIKNLINWFRWYYPDNEIIIIDNNSDSEEVLHFYDSITKLDNIDVVLNPENNCAENLKRFLSGNEFEYYIISDPDIMPHPATQPNFLEMFKDAIDIGYHHAGFGLITNDIPEWVEKKAEIRYNESELLKQPIECVLNGTECSGFKAPTDTTFALYKRDNGGWTAPMSGEAWSNSLRLLQAFHLGWYIHPDHVNPEMDHYFKTAKYRDLSPVSAGKNNNRPNKYV